MISRICCWASLSLSAFLLMMPAVSMAADPLGDFMKSGTPSSVPRLSITASMLRTFVKIPASDRQRWDLFAKDSGSLLTLESIFQEYQYRLLRDQSDAEQYRTTGWLLSGSLIVGGVFVPAGTVPSILKGLGSAGASFGIKSSVDELMQYGFRQTSLWLENSLLELTGKGRITDLSGIQPFSAEQRREWLRQEGLIKDLLAKAGDVRPEDRPIIEGMLVRALNERINRSLDIQKDRDREQDEVVARQSHQIGAVARSLQEFKTATEADLKDIRTRQTALEEKVASIAQQTEQNRGDIEFLQGFMFDKMDPAEQLAALRGGMFPGMSTAERDTLIRRIEIVEQRQSLVQAVGTFAQGAGTVARISARLGVDPNVVEGMQKAAALANVAQTAAIGLMSGGMGYLAAADAVSSLVFGSGPDPGAQRHAEVMGALNQIRQGIAEIEGMLVEMSKQLDQIMQAQRVIYDALVEVSKQIQSNHREVMAELARVRADLVPIASVVNEILFKDIEACDWFQKLLVTQGFDRHRAIPYPTLRLLHRGADGNGNGRQCLNGLRNILRDPLTSVSHDLRRFKGEPSSPTDVFLEQIYAPTYNFFRDWLLINKPTLVAKSFGIPVNSLRALSGKTAELFGGTPPNYATRLSRRSESDIRRLLSVCLSPQVIARHVQFLLFAHPFFELDEALEDPTPGRLVAGDTTSIEGRELLLSALDLIETAIAQQVMLAGDAGLAGMLNIWQEGPRARENSESDAAFGRRQRAWNDWLKVLNTNVALRRNLTLYGVDAAVKLNGNALLYGTAFGLANDASYLQKLLPQPQFRIVWKAPVAGEKPAANYSDPSLSTGWHIEMGDQVYPLPEPKELSTGLLIQTPDLRTLLDLKNATLTELHNYRIMEQLPVFQRAVMRQAIWQVANFYR